MKIKSEIGTGSLYGDDSLEAFYNAVENGQARLALQFLSEIVEVLIDKIEFIENKIGIEEVQEVVETPAVVEVTKAEEPTDTSNTNSVVNTPAVEEVQVEEPTEEEKPVAKKAAAKTDK